MIIAPELPAPSPTADAPVPNPKRSRRRFVCVHGHFYQPPRENPWLETVEAQSSAAPYHDWNDRITAECYAPNGASRITDRAGEITRISNNYARMSFNFGATLLSWLKDNAPRAYRMILDADKASAQRFSGHGSALAQVYSHVILPLASERDARTQIRWGIRDFESRFGRRPEGMWLAETAVDRRSLDLLAQEGIRFTILAPHQCRHVRRLPNADVSRSEGAAGAAEPARNAKQSPHAAAARAAGEPELAWTPTPNATVDTTHPYRVPLDDGRSIDVFFYNGPASRAIAFEGLLNSGESFGQSLVKHLSASDRDAGAPAQISHVATDGESYGHHHKHGDMALSYAMHWIEDRELATLTNYGEFLELFPPGHEAEVVDNSSWSCAHGVERWRSDCGCNGGKPGWNQRWRRPLREALDTLRDAIVPLAEVKARPLVVDLWAARDQYIDVILDRSNFNKDRFLVQHAAKTLSFAERTQVWELLELQRQSQLMYTSCGWFFDEISGIETVQIIAYAGRVLQLAGRLFGAEIGGRLEADFLAKLAEAESNVPGIGNGAEVYRRYVTGLRIGLLEVGAHYAISSAFRAYPDTGTLFCFDIHRDNHEVLASGRGKLALGRAEIRSRITDEMQKISYAVLHLGDQNLSAAVKPTDRSELAACKVFSADVSRALKRANLPEVIRLIDRSFGGITYSLNSLFADEQTRIVRTILDQTLSEMENSLRKIYEDHASLLHFLTETGVEIPAALALATNFATNASLRAAIEADMFNTVEVETLLARAKADHVTLDVTTLAFAAGQRMKRAMVALESSAATGGAVSIAALQNALLIADSLRTFPFEVTLWGAQNIWNDLLRRSDSNLWSPEWRDGFRKLGLALSISVDHLVIEEGVPTF